MKIAVVGAGSWGTALAQVLADKGEDVTIWARRQEVATEISMQHTNNTYLPGAVLNANIESTASIADCISGADAIVLSTPSSYVRQTAQAMSAFLGADIPIVICSKGVEAQSGLLMTQILEDELGGESRIAVLSGPTHAEEVVKGQPSAAVIASIDENIAKFFVQLFITPQFRTYGSADPIGVELCAAFKNVIAIAVGISYGMGFGDNTAAMLITRGLAEMSRMVSACGGEAITCLGLAGAGDMVVTCMSRHSRNRRFGEDYIARGRSLEDFKNDTHMVVEGAIACQTLDVLAKRHNVELPITDAIKQIIWEGAKLTDLADALISRPAKPEFYGL